MHQIWDEHMLIGFFKDQRKEGQTDKHFSAVLKIVC